MVSLILSRDRVHFAVYHIHTARKPFRYPKPVNAHAHAHTHASSPPVPELLALFTSQWPSLGSSSAPAAPVNEEQLGQTFHFRRRHDPSQEAFTGGAGLSPVNECA